MSGQKCDVCGNKADGVASSTIGAISFAYCESCNSSQAEPYGFLVKVIEMFFGEDWRIKIKDEKYLNETIDSTLKAIGKTREDFEKDVDQCVEESLQDEFIDKQIDDLVNAVEGNDGNV
jgi:hypothetical protein